MTTCPRNLIIGKAKSDFINNEVLRVRTDLSKELNRHFFARSWYLAYPEIDRSQFITWDKVSLRL